MDNVLRRVTALEGDMKEVKADMKGLVKSVASIEGRLHHMPTLWGIAGTMLGINAGIVAVAALAVRFIR